MNSKKIFLVLIVGTLFSITIYFCHDLFVFRKTMNQQLKQIDSKLWNFSQEPNSKESFSVNIIADSEKNLSNQKVIITPFTAANLQKKCKNAIVKVINDRFSFNWQEPYKNTEQVESRGSGFFINDEGYFLTNFHVVSQGLRVLFQMPIFGQDKLSCSVVGVCPDRDLALLKISDDSKAKILKKLGKVEYLEFGNSDNVGRGCEVLTLGFPLGKDVIKSTTGIVSGWEDIRLGERGGALSCLETTAPINEGSSGGPALDLQGKVVGINFSGITKAQNIGYVLPINELQSAIKQLEKQKLLFKPHLGFISQTTSKSFAKYFGNPQDGGLYVRRVLKGSLAEKAGLKAGDVIYEINKFFLDHHGDTVVPWREDKVFYTNVLQRLEINDEIEILIYRKGERKVIKFNLENSDDSIKIRSRYPCFEKIDYEVFGGLVIMELAINHVSDLYQSNPSLLKYALPENMDQPLLIVTFIQSTSQAHKNAGGIGKGNIIKTINGVAVNNLVQLRSEIKKSLDKEFITISGDDLSLSVFQTKKLFDDEKRLSKIFRYHSNHSIILESLLHPN